MEFFLLLSMSFDLPKVMWGGEISHQHHLLLYGLFLLKSYKKERLFVQAIQNNLTLTASPIITREDNLQVLELMKIPYHAHSNFWGLM